MQSDKVHIRKFLDFLADPKHKSRCALAKLTLVLQNCNICTIPSISSMLIEETGGRQAVWPLIHSNTALTYLLASQLPRHFADLSRNANQKCLLTLCIYAPEHRLSAEEVIEYVNHFCLLWEKKCHRH